MPWKLFVNEGIKLIERRISKKKTKTYIPNKNLMCNLSTQIINVIYLYVFFSVFSLFTEYKAVKEIKPFDNKKLRRQIRNTTKLSYCLNPSRSQNVNQLIQTHHFNQLMNNYLLKQFNLNDERISWIRRHTHTHSEKSDKNKVREK